MKETDIRPSDLSKEYAVAYLADLQQLLQYTDQFVKANCPACESTIQRPVYTKSGFTFMQCRICGTLFVSPRPTVQMLGEWYGSSKALQCWNKICTETEEARKQFIFLPRAKRVLELCQKYNTGSQMLVDVGAGAGTFCWVMKEQGHFETVMAIEPAAQAAASCRGKGIQVIEAPIEYVTLPPVDVVTNFELIEHLYSPKDFLIACKRVMNPKSLLILTTPNIRGFDMAMLGVHAKNLSAPNHLNYFHPESITHLLTKCGFDVLEILTPGRLDAEIVRQGVLQGLCDLTNQPFLHRVLIEEWEILGEDFQSFLADQKLSSHMWVVARIMDKSV